MVATGPFYICTAASAVLSHVASRVPSSEQSMITVVHSVIDTGWKESIPCADYFQLVCSQICWIKCAFW